LSPRSSLRDSEKSQRNINRSPLGTRPIRISLWQSYPRRDHSALIITCLKFRPHEVSQFYAPPRSLETLTRGTDISHESVTTVTRERSIHLPVCDIPPPGTRKKETWTCPCIFSSLRKRASRFARVGFPITILHCEFCPMSPQSQSTSQSQSFDSLRQFLPRVHSSQRKALLSLALLFTRSVSVFPTRCCFPAAADHQNRRSIVVDFPVASLSYFCNVVGWREGQRVFFASKRTQGNAYSVRRSNERAREYSCLFTLSKLLPDCPPRAWPLLRTRS